MTLRSGIAARLLTGQMLVLLVAGGTLVGTVLLIAPGLFRYHLEHAGEESPLVQQHAQEAFATTMAIAVGIAALAAGGTAAALSWRLSRQVGRPVEDLAGAAAAIATGDYAVRVPAAGYGSELTALAGSFQHMADQLAATDAARTRMLADLAHELRTPLATLEAHIDGLEDGIVPTTAASYATMRQQVERLRRLAADIKMASAAAEHRLGLTLRPEPLEALLRAAHEAALPRYQANGVALRYTGAVDGPVVQADVDRFGQILGNLLDNALRHTPTGGRVTLSAQVEAEWAVVEVADTGDGVPAAELETIFQRFHRVDAARSSGDGGSGLGLTIARALAIEHGGTLTADSDGPGSGTVLRLRLPIGAGQRGRQPVPHPPLRLPQRQASSGAGPATGSQPPG